MSANPNGPHFWPADRKVFWFRKKCVVEDYWFGGSTYKAFFFLPVTFLQEFLQFLFSIWSQREVKYSKGIAEAKLKNWVLSPRQVSLQASTAVDAFFFFLINIFTQSTKLHFPGQKLIADHEPLWNLLVCLLLNLLFCTDKILRHWDSHVWGFH